MFRADLSHTGIFETKGVTRLREVKRKFKTARVVEPWFSSPTVADGAVYFGIDDGSLYALDEEDG